VRDRPTEDLRAHPWDEAPDGGGVSFGGWLKHQREVRGISLREIANVTKITIRYLEALEDSRFSILPAPVFARGFLRQYASYVGLDPDEVVNYYIVAQQEVDQDADLEAESGSRLHSSTHWAYGLFFTIGMVVLLGLVLLLTYLHERQPSVAEEPPPIAVPIFSPRPERVPNSAEDSPASLVVTLDFIQDCWVEAWVDGENRVSELRVQGESLRLDAEEVVVLTLGNVQGVRIEVNGEDYPLPTDRGDVVSDLEIRLALPEEAI